MLATGPHERRSGRRRRCLRQVAAGCAIALLGAAAASAETAPQTPAPAVALPQLPAKVRDQLEIESLERAIEIIRLERELEDMNDAANSDLAKKVAQLQDMQTLLEVNANVRDLAQDAPELDAYYWRILDVDAPAAACRCLEAARVNWLGGGSQAGRATVRVDGRHHEVAVGDTIGDSRCILQAADAETATLSCGGNVQTLRLYSPVGR